MPLTAALTRKPAQRLCRAVALTLLAGIALQPTTHAASQGVSAQVRSACSSDYFALCSKHAVGSPALRTCMSANGPRLSSRCLNALVAAGEVTPKTVAKRKALAGAN